jgi:hypothetical protein
MNYIKFKKKKKISTPHKNKKEMNGFKSMKILQKSSLPPQAHSHTTHPPLHACSKK